MCICARASTPAGDKQSPAHKKQQCSSDLFCTRATTPSSTDLSLGRIIKLGGVQHMEVAQVSVGHVVAATARRTHGCQEVNINQLAEGVVSAVIPGGTIGNVRCSTKHPSVPPDTKSHASMT
jgi:hypothetical protein